MTEGRIKLESGCKEILGVFINTLWLNPGGMKKDVDRTAIICRKMSLQLNGKDKGKK